MRDVSFLLEGRNRELADTLEPRMLEASEDMRPTSWLRSIETCEDSHQAFRTTKDGDDFESDIDIFGYYREGQRLALQLFTMREGNIVGRREFFWEDLPEDHFDPAEFLSEVLPSTTRPITCRENLRPG